MNMHSQTSTRLGAALLVGGGLLFGAVPSRAAIIYSGVVDIPIPTTFAGIYLDIATGGTTAPTSGSDVATDSYTVGYSEPLTWDVNFFFGGIGIAYSPTFRPFVDDTVGNRSQILNVSDGTVISTAAASRTVGTDTYGGSGRSNQSTGSSHFDTPTVGPPAYSAFTPGVAGYIAFVLNPGTEAQQYGWINVTLTNDGTEGTIHAWAYSDEESFTVAQIPEPNAATALVIAAALAASRRRRPNHGAAPANPR